jgi:hypothetical protein
VILISSAYVALVVTPILTVTNAGAADLFLYPRAGVVGVTNAAITDSWDYIRLFDERLKCVVAQSSAGVGAITVLAEEDVH